MFISGFYDSDKGLGKSTRPDPLKFLRQTEAILKRIRVWSSVRQQNVILPSRLIWSNIEKSVVAEKSIALRNISKMSFQLKLFSEADTKCLFFTEFHFFYQFPST